MTLDNNQINHFNVNGFLLVSDVFKEHEIDKILKFTKTAVQEDCPRRVLEKNGSVRSFFAPEFSSRFFFDLNRLSRLVVPAQQLIKEDVYVYQSKINIKTGMLGDWWKWHRDFTFWKNDDGMKKPDVLTIMIFLEDINEYNGPLLMIPRSHTLKPYDDHRIPASLDDDYSKSLIADLKYSISKEVISKWIEDEGLVSAKGLKGSVLFFHGNILHASSNNMSPWDRHTLLITYNSVKNALPRKANPRPEFIARRTCLTLDLLDESQTSLFNF